MATVAEATFEQYFLLPHVSWQTYEALLTDLDQRAIRLTFDRGDLERGSKHKANEPFPPPVRITLVIPR